MLPDKLELKTQELKYTDKNKVINDDTFEHDGKSY